jgi:hypothetical protein
MKGLLNMSENRKWYELVSVRNATDDELKRLKGLTDDELLRSATSLDMFAAVESTRRLREVLHREEKAIKWLTVVLVILTILLIALTGVLIWLAIEARR